MPIVDRLFAQMQPEPEDPESAPPDLVASHRSIELLQSI